MDKEHALRTLGTVSYMLNQVAQGEVTLGDVMPTVMEASDLLDDAIGIVESNLTDKPAKETNNGDGIPGTGAI